MDRLVVDYRDILRLRLSRRSALSMHCPKCKAAPNDPCTGQRDPTNLRVSPHIERYDAAARVMRVPA